MLDFYCSLSVTAQISYGINNVFALILICNVIRVTIRVRIFTDPE